MDTHNVDHVVMRDAEEVLQYSLLGTSTNNIDMEYSYRQRLFFLKLPLKCDSPQLNKHRVHVHSSVNATMSPIYHLWYISLWMERRGLSLKGIGFSMTLIIRVIIFEALVKEN